MVAVMAMVSVASFSAKHWTQRPRDTPSADLKLRKPTNTIAGHAPNSPQVGKSKRDRRSLIPEAGGRNDEIKDV